MGWSSSPFPWIEGWPNPTYVTYFYMCLLHVPFPLLHKHVHLCVCVCICLDYALFILT